MPNSKKSAVSKTKKPEMVEEKVKVILNAYQCNKGQLISILQDIQAECRYLPKEALVCVSENLDIPLTRVYSVATFFRAFSLKPRGRHVINCCLGTACHVRGAPKILDRFEQEMGIKAGETTKDMKFTLETVNCLGACALGPIAVIDGEYAGGLTPDKVKALLEKYD